MTVSSVNADGPELEANDQRATVRGGEGPRAGGERGQGHGAVDIRLQGLEASLFELQLLLEVNHLPLQLVDLDDRKPHRTR